MVLKELNEIMDRINDERTFFNEYYQNPNIRKSVFKFYNLLEEAKQNYRNILRQNCQQVKMLELGCGRAKTLFYLVQHEAIVTGIDISDKVILANKIEAKRRNLNIDFAVMDAESLAFNDNSFDIVYGSTILHHLDVEKAYKEMTRVLKPEGKAIFLEPLGHNPFINLFRRFTPHLRTKNEHPLIKKDLELVKTYFNNVSLEFYVFTPLLVFFIPSLAFKLNKFDKHIFKILPKSRYLAWQCIIKLSKPVK
jgi:ubiquinone/menaquinone biosynthesis C-methylase UbiE